jgi:acyl carrier protein
MDESLQEDLFALIRKALGQEADGMALNPATAIGALGLGSLQLIEIIYEIESKYGLTADEQLLAELVTVGDLLGVFECEEQLRSSGAEAE